MIVQHVLVPIDFSATADQALTYAIALAQQLQARLTLLHVLDLTPMTMDEMTAGVVTTYLDDLETDAQHLLQASRERVQRAGLQAESLLVQGTPTQTIVDTAGEQGVDLIIMGTHGRTGLAHVFLGSVAEHVVRQGPCPVLVVRRAPDPSAPAGETLPE
jgi:nucleotide-binding universal stress UspA family protein